MKDVIAESKASTLYVERTMIKIGSMMDKGEYKAFTLDEIVSELELAVTGLWDTVDDEEMIFLLRRITTCIIGSIAVHQEETRRKADAEYQKSIGGTGGPSEYE